VVEIRSHARHDRFAIAEALGSGGIPTTVGTCPACGALHRDLLSIQTALRHAWTPRRPRDLRLDVADVARLRPVLWRRFLATIGSSRDAVTKPLALGLTSLGFAGLVLANVPVGFIGASGAASATTPAEKSMAVDTPSGMPATNQQRDPNAPGRDPVVIVSVASLVAAGTILGVRRLARRAGPMR
jgi:hypothetical protein